MLGPKCFFGHKRPLMDGKSGTNGGSHWNTCGGTTVDAKLVTQGYGNGPKMVKFGPKTLFIGHKRPKRPLMDGKSGKNSGSQGTTLELLITVEYMWED